MPSPAASCGVGSPRHGVRVSQKSQKQRALKVESEHYTVMMHDEDDDNGDDSDNFLGIFIRRAFK